MKKTIFCRHFFSIDTIQTKKNIFFYFLFFFIKHNLNLNIGQIIRIISCFFLLVDLNLYFFIVYISFPPSFSIKSLNFSYTHFRLEYKLILTPVSALSLELHFLQSPTYQQIKSHFERLLLIFQYCTVLCCTVLHCAVL